MHSLRFLEAQTSLIDLYLPELLQSSVPNLGINFNNTRQFDALLRYLEDSLQTPNFVLVPSTNVLHILVTLCCRSPNSNWTHKSSHLEAISASTEYMRQVNTEYDHTLYKMPLLERSRLILEKYMALVNNILGPTTEQLYANMEKVFVSLVPYNIKSFFSPRKQRSDPAPVEPKVDAELLGLPKEVVVEVISDSEESDKAIEMFEPHDVASKYRQLNIPIKSITSLSDLGNRTSGLGETTLLFQNMPHLLAHATPEPEPVSRKKPKASVNPINQIQVYDDSLLAKKLEAEAYDIWNLLRWALQCADLALEYQKFLFNSCQTNVHWVYRTYEGFFRVFFDFVAVQYIHGLGKKLHLLSRILTLLGPKMDWNDRAAEFLFTGLGIASNSRCYPCYDRERLLIRYDPAILVSRCKTLVEFCDNQHSMGLRYRIMCVLYYRLKTEKGNVADFIDNVAAKLAQVQIDYVASFFDSVSTEHVAGITHDVGIELLALLARQLLVIVTGMDVCGWTYSATYETNIANVSELVLNEKVYASISEDLGYKSFHEFEHKWSTLMYLLQWMLTQVLTTGDTDTDMGVHFERLEAAVGVGDTLCARFYADFLDSRAENADVRADDIHFTLADADVARYKQEFRPPLGHVLCIR